MAVGDTKIGGLLGLPRKCRHRCDNCSTFSRPRLTTEWPRLNLHRRSLQSQGAFEILYFSEHADTMLREVRTVQYDVDGNAISAPSQPYVAISLQYELTLTVDLSDPGIQAHSRSTTATSRQRGNYSTCSTASRQSPKTSARRRDAGIEALIVPSARHAGLSNIDVIRDQLLESSYIRIHQPTGFPPGTATEIRGFKKTRNERECCYVARGAASLRATRSSTRMPRSAPKRTWARSLSRTNPPRSASSQKRSIAS